MDNRTYFEMVDPAGNLMPLYINSADVERFVKDKLSKGWKFPPQGDPAPEASAAEDIELEDDSSDAAPDEGDDE